MRIGEHLKTMTSYNSVFKLWNGSKHEELMVMCYHGVGEAGRVRVEVELDPVDGPWQRQPPDQQHHQHQVGEGGREVHHLRQEAEAPVNGGRHSQQQECQVKECDDELNIICNIIFSNVVPNNI